ncbi:helix-turn-helix domain-containing protein [Rhodohalobacter halophilus]|uniref:helix-turn-helix domain-containing protein n=1 Tax=Rhodohalobacter halophilus TaxID=1812810 RepID=UPI001C405495|nr:helix-turn-helix transcriptional regulator [Rhodohalobacter halophilus]
MTSHILYSQPMQFCEKIKDKRITQGLLQRQVATALEIDTPLYSKIERGERKAKRSQIHKIAEVLNIDSEELLILWLADQVYEIVKDENVAAQVLKVAEEGIKYSTKKD